MAEDAGLRAALADTVRSVRVVGDERWAAKGEVPTQESVAGMVEEALGGSVTGLTEEEVRAIFDAATGE